MRYSAAISAAVKGEDKKKVPNLLGPIAQLFKCPRCKCYDEINLKQKFEWLKPFHGYVHTELCQVCIMELRRSNKK